MQPVQSSTAEASSPLPMALMTPSSMATSATRDPFSSTTVPPRSTSSWSDNVGPRSQQLEQDGTAHGDAVGDLARDDRAREVGDLGRDLDAAVHRTRMHHQ